MRGRMSGRVKTSSNAQLQFLQERKRYNNVPSPTVNYLCNDRTEAGHLKELIEKRCSYASCMYRKNFKPYWVWRRYFDR